MSMMYLFISSRGGDSVIAQPVAPVVSSVSVSDTTPTESDLLSVSYEQTGATSVAIAWFAANDTAGAGIALIGTGATLTVLGAHVGKYLSARVTATNSAGSISVYSSYTAQVQSSPVVTTGTRIAEDGSRRITEDNNILITE